MRRRLHEPAVDQAALLAPLEALVKLDLGLRTRAVAAHQLSVERELFLFGRPIFHLLAPLGIRAVPATDGLRLTLARSPAVAG